MLLLRTKKTKQNHFALHVLVQAQPGLGSTFLLSKRRPIVLLAKTAKLCRRSLYLISFHFNLVKKKNSSRNSCCQKPKLRYEDSQKREGWLLGLFCLHLFPLHFHHQTSSQTNKPILTTRVAEGTDNLFSNVKEKYPKVVRAESMALFLQVVPCQYLLQPASGESHLYLQHLRSLAFSCYSQCRRLRPQHTHIKSLTGFGPVSTVTSVLKSPEVNKWWNETSSW